MRAFKNQSDLSFLLLKQLQTELDDTKSYYQLIKKYTISEKRRIAKL